MRHAAKRTDKDRTIIKRVCIKLFFSIVLLTAILLSLSLTGGPGNINLAGVQQGADKLRDFVNTCYLRSVLIFILSYVTLTLYLPAAALLTLLGGYLFGVPQAILYVITAAVSASVLSFCISRYMAGDYIQRRWHDALAGFNENVAQFAPEYLVLVRLIPMLPFLLINVFAGLTRVSLRTFVWTTIVGILPGVVIFSCAGRRLQTLKSVTGIMTEDISLAIMLLVRIAAAVCLLRHIKSKKDGKVSEIIVSGV